MSSPPLSTPSLVSVSVSVSVSASVSVSVSAAPFAASAFLASATTAAFLAAAAAAAAAFAFAFARLFILFRRLLGSLLLLHGHLHPRLVPRLHQHPLLGRVERAEVGLELRLALFLGQPHQVARARHHVVPRDEPAQRQQPLELTSALQQHRRVRQDHRPRHWTSAPL